jgi:glycosyltransferase involved in cell wall biosynthesis
MSLREKFADIYPMLQQNKASSQKRILMVTEALARGGAERQMLALSEGLSEHGYAVEVLELTGVVPGQASFADEFRGRGIKPQLAQDLPPTEDDYRTGLSVCAELSPYRDILPERLGAICGGLIAAIARFRPHVVYCWSDLASLLGGFTAARCQIASIVLGQRTFPPPFWVEPPVAETYRLAYAALLAKPNMTMINISERSAEAYAKWLGVNHPIKVIRNGFVAASLTTRDDQAAKFRRSLGIPDGAPVVGTVMRFAPEKDPVLWLQTAAAVAAARPDAHFILNGYGHGDIATQLRDMGEALGLTGRLHMPAMIVEVGLVYSVLTVFLLTSRTDATPNALLEAQACGVPVVAPAVGGIDETLVDGVTGALVSDRSPHALAAAVLALLRDPMRRRLAQAHGPGFVAQRFGFKRMIKETIATWARNLDFDDDRAGQLS